MSPGVAWELSLAWGFPASMVALSALFGALRAHGEARRAMGGRMDPRRRRLALSREAKAMLRGWWFRKAALKAAALIAAFGALGSLRAIDPSNPLARGEDPLLVTWGLAGAVLISILWAIWLHDALAAMGRRAGARTPEDDARSESEEIEAALGSASPAPKARARPRSL